MWEEKEGEIAVNTVPIYEIKRIWRVKGGHQQMKHRESITAGVEVLLPDTIGLIPN